MYNCFRFLFMCLVWACAVGHVASAQSTADYKEFYAQLRFNALEQPTPLYPVQSPDSAVHCYGIARDTTGRITTITRFFFGNPEAGADWTTMQIRYQSNPTGDTLRQIRTYHGPGMAPLTIGKKIVQENIVSLANGQLRSRELLDAAGKLTDDSNWVCRSTYRYLGKNTIQEQWFISNGKGRYAPPVNGPMRTFTPVPPPKVYYRIFTFNEKGSLTSERLLSLTKTPVNYPNGEFVRTYQYNRQGLPQRIFFQDTAGATMTDAEGTGSLGFEYDKEGRRIREDFYDADGNRTARKSDKVGSVVYEYRAFDGVLLYVIRLDIAGREIGREAPAGEQGK